MLIEEWKALHLAHRRPRYAAEAERAIRFGLPGLLRRPAARISRYNNDEVIYSDEPAESQFASARVLAAPVGVPTPALGGASIAGSAQPVR